MMKRAVLFVLYFSLMLRNFTVSLEKVASSFKLKNNQDRIYEAVNPRSSNIEIAIAGTFGEVQEFFERKNWSDGITIIPPTTDKIEKYLLFTPYQGDKILVNGATTYNVAVNAVMSGCSPQMMPLCIAITEAMGNNEIVNSKLSSKYSICMGKWTYWKTVGY